jgi:hypothetical protein
MEDIKTVLKALPKVDKVYVKEDGSWLFNKPAEGEYMECTREDILGTPIKKVEPETKEGDKEKVVSIDGNPSEENPAETLKAIEIKPAEDKPAPSPLATAPIPVPKK